MKTAQIDEKENNSQKKLFVNMCQSKLLGAPAEIKGEDGEMKLRVPLSAGPLREDVDKGIVHVIALFEPNRGVQWHYMVICEPPRGQPVPGCGHYLQHASDCAVPERRGFQRYYFQFCS